MTSLPMARRDADDFAALVDGDATARATRFAELMETVEQLRSVDVPAPRPEFLTDLRARLMHAADELLVPATEVARPVPAHPRSRSRFGSRTRRRFATVAAAAVLVGSTAGMAAAADGANPGDPLYTLKRGIENAELSLATSDASRGAQMLHNADTRLDEVRNLVQSSADISRIESTLKDFRSSAGEGADLLFRSYQGGGNATEISRVHSFTSKQSTALDALASEAPPTASDAFASASSIVADIEQQARVLCLSCGEGAPLTLSDAITPTTDALTTLLQQPVDAIAQQQAQLESLRAQAEKATAQAKQTPPAPTTSTSTSTNTTTPGPLTPPALPKVTDTVGSKPITDLLTTVAPEGSPLAPITQPLGQTLDQTVGGVTQMIDGLLQPKPTP